jgi:hypothetical protein
MRPNSEYGRAEGLDVDDKFDSDDSAENSEFIIDGEFASVHDTNSDTDEDLSAYDPANFIRNVADIAAETPLRPLEYLRVGRPNNKMYVRASTKYRMAPVYILTWTQHDKEVDHLVLGSCVPKVLPLVGDVIKAYSLNLMAMDTGGYFLWPVRELSELDGSSWTHSRHAALVAAQQKWVRIKSNRANQEYEITLPEDTLPEPKWPDVPFAKLLKVGFGKRIIDSIDHPIVKAVRGKR